MTDEPVALKALLRERHWKYATFCAEYDKVARTLDPRLTGTWPSRAQFQRWLAGELRGVPYPDACRVLEAMFPGWTIEQLFARYQPPRPALSGQAGVEADDTKSQPRDGGSTDIGLLVADRFQDVTAVYATRSEFISNMPAHTLFDNATKHPRLRTVAQPAVPAVRRAQPAAAGRGRHARSSACSSTRTAQRSGSASRRRTTRQARCQT